MTLTLSLDQMIATLTAAGYRVTKPSPRRSRSLGSCERRCGSPAAMRYTLGGTRRRSRSIEVCHDCMEQMRRETPSTLRQPNNPERYARLFRLWRKAHHRYHGTIGVTHGAHAYRVHPRYAAILKAIQQEVSPPGAVG